MWDRFKDTFGIGSEKHFGIEMGLKTTWILELFLIKW